jgi:putative FmdB family regulatory protein
MPTYEYRCEKGHEFEAFQRMSEAPVEKCIHCGAPAERLMSAGSGLIFKGSGFYITDYARSESYKKAAESDKGSSSSTSTTPSTPAAPAASSTPAPSPSKSSDSSSSKSSGTSGSD